MEKEKIRKILEQHWKRKKRKPKIYPCQNKYGLLGFYSEAKKITLDKNNVIKKVSAKERDEFYERSGLKNNDYRYKYNFMFFHFYEGYLRASLDKPLYRQKHLLVFFKIFMDKSIAMPYNQRYIKSIKTGRFESMEFITIPKEYFYEEKPYLLTKKDIPEFKKLWKSYSKINFESNKAFAIVVNRYYFSLQRVYPEDQIIDLMIAFEALFVKATSELSFRLTLTMVTFLEKHFQREWLYSFMKKAYTLRSKIAHGSEPSKKDLKVLGREWSMKEFTLGLTEILRVSMNEYVKNHSSLNVPEFIDKVEKAIISGEKL